MPERLASSVKKSQYKNTKETRMNFSRKNKVSRESEKERENEKSTTHKKRKKSK